MIVSTIVFLAALAMAGIAAYVSIIGLAAIFSAAGVLFIAFAASMEVAKVSCALWLHAHWKDKGLFLIKSGMMMSVIVLMLFTSMGVFGFLSKSHIEQTAPLAGMAETSSVMELKIESLQSRVDRNNKLIEQLDTAIQGYIDNDYITKAIQVREAQSEDRAKISSENDTLQSEIDSIRLQLAESNTKRQLIETEVGPIKYAAELLYGSSEKDVVEEAVRLLIMMMVLVFDPLAIMMLVAAQHSFSQRKKEKPMSDHEWRKLMHSNAVDIAERHLKGTEDVEVPKTEIVEQEEVTNIETPEEPEPEVGVGLSPNTHDQVFSDIDLSKLPERRRRMIQRVLSKNKKLIDRLSS